MPRPHGAPRFQGFITPYYTPIPDALFDELLLTVENTSADAHPSIRLPNAIAKEKAKHLRERKGEYF